MRPKRNDYILELLETGSFSKTAKKLNISQPALSSYLASLEQSLSCILVDRSAVPLALTPEGEVYVDYLKKTYELDLDMKNKLADLSNQNQGTLILAGANCYCSGILSYMSSCYQKKYPNINIRIIDGRIPELKQKLGDNTIDLLILPTSECDTELCSFKIFDEQIFLCVPNTLEYKDINEGNKSAQIPLKEVINGDNKESSRPFIRSSSIQNEKFILLDNELEIRKIADQYLTQHNITPGHIIQVNQISTSFSLSTLGAGLSFVTETALTFGNYNNIPILYKLDLPLSSRSVSIAYKKGRYFSHSMKAFINILQRKWKGKNYG